MNSKDVITEMIISTLTTKKPSEKLLFGKYHFSVELCKGVNLIFRVQLDNQDNCEMEFVTDFEKRRIELDAIRVDEKRQRTGIGTELFDVLSLSVEALNSIDNYLFVNKIDTITGELSPYEYPYDEYEKSVPFYIKQANLRSWKIRLYKLDEYRNRKEINNEELGEFTKSYCEGAFEYTI